MHINVNSEFILILTLQSANILSNGTKKREKRKEKIVKYHYYNGE